MLKYVDATGRIFATDDSVGGSPTIFDTNDGLLHVDPEDYFSGSVTLPALSATSSGADGSRTFVDRLAEYFIGTPSTPNANIALGQFRKSGETFWESAWGSHILDMDAVGDTFVPQADLVSQRYLTTMRTVTPLINNLGHLVFRERTIIRARDPGSPPAITLTLPAVTLEYRMFSGAWWGNSYNEPRSDAALRSGGPTFTTSANLSMSMDAGYGYPNRRIVVVIQNALRATNPSSVTIGGVAATIHDTIATTNTRTTIASAVVPSGEILTIAINNVSTANTWVGVTVFAVRSLTGNAPTIYKTSATSATNDSLALPATANAAAIVVSTKNGGTSSTCTWTNATEVIDTTMSGFTSGVMSAAIMDTVPGNTVTGAWTSTAGEISMIGAVFT